MKPSTPSSSPEGAFPPIPPRVLVVGHALKESLGVQESRRSLEAGVREAGGIVCGTLCLSDGGDGFLDAYAEIRPAAVRLEVPATGPLGGPIVVPFLLEEAALSRSADVPPVRPGPAGSDRPGSSGRSGQTVPGITGGTSVPHGRTPNEGGATAVIESARVCGLALVPPGERDVMRSTTAGLGDLLAEALGRGARRVLVGLGGSATTDGGAGMLLRLGERLLGLAPGPPAGPETLPGLGPFPFDGLRRALEEVEIVACTDVTNPLLGPEGSAAVFAPQKGAAPAQVAELERLLTGWAGRIEEGLGCPGLREEPGAGAAGGLGFAFLALDAVLRPGVEVLFELSRFDELLAGCDLVITSEGRFDLTSLRGKAPWQVAVRARAAGRRAAIVCGSADPDAVRTARARGVDVVPFAETVPPPERARRAPALLRSTVARYLQEQRPGAGV